MGSSPCSRWNFLSLPGVAFHILVQRHTGRCMVDSLFVGRSRDVSSCGWEWKYTAAEMEQNSL